jgi:hypothetical protein
MTQGAFVEPEAVEIFIGVYTDSILCALAFGLTEQESQGNLEKLTQVDCEKTYFAGATADMPAARRLRK